MRQTDSNEREEAAVVAGNGSLVCLLNGLKSSLGTAKHVRGEAGVKVVFILVGCPHQSEVS